MWTSPKHRTPATGQPGHASRVTLRPIGDIAATEGCDAGQLDAENLPALAAGIANLERHVDNVQQQFGLPCVVAVNHFTHDTTAEFDLVSARMDQRGVRVVSARHWAAGGKGAEELAHAVVALASQKPSRFRFVYEDSQDTVGQVDRRRDLDLWRRGAKHPAALRIDIDAQGKIVGLF